MSKGQSNNFLVDLEVMKNTLENFKETMNSFRDSFDEFKKETKEYHEFQSKRYHHLAEIATKMNILLDDWGTMKKDIDDLKKWRTAGSATLGILAFLITIGIIKLNRLF